MTHSRSWDMEIGRPSVENVTVGQRTRVTFSTSGSSYIHVPLTTVRHLLNADCCYAIKTNQLIAQLCPFAEPDASAFSFGKPVI